MRVGPRGSIVPDQGESEPGSSHGRRVPFRRSNSSAGQPQPSPPPFGGAMAFVSPFASANAAQPVVLAAAAPSSASASTSVATVPSARANSRSSRSGRPTSAGGTGAGVDQTGQTQRIMADENHRRRSVDVSTLGTFTRVRHDRPTRQLSATPELSDGRSARFSTPNSPDPALHGTPRLAQSQIEASEPSIREALFADHLSAILHHTMSLCLTPAAESITPIYTLETMSEDEDEGEAFSPLMTPDDSPRSSLTAESTLDAVNSAGNSASSCPASSRPRKSRPGRLRRLPSLPSITPRRHAELVEMLSTWAFNAHDLDLDELCECASIMFEAALLMHGVDEVATTADLNRIRALLLSLRAAYHARNPYHNFTHATDVLQAMYSFIVQLGLAPPLSVLLERDPTKFVWHRDPAVDARGAIGEVLRPADIFTLMIAAIGHDVGHPGLSNAYMVNARTPVAQVYGDKSVLENFHSITLVHMLRRHGFGNLLDEQPAQHGFRKVLSASVLATDMSNHFAFVASLTQMATRLKTRLRTPEELEEDRLIVCSGLMKCADISNPTRPHNIARTWSSALLEEWAEQARIEAEFKLPISVVTLNPAEKKAQAKSQVGFINLFTQPLFDAMTACCPDFRTFADSCREGRRVWEAIVIQPDYAASITPGPLSPLRQTLDAEETTPSAARQPMSMSRRRPAPRPLATIPSAASSPRMDRRSIDSSESLPVPGSTATSSSVVSPRSPAFSNASPSPNTTANGFRTGSPTLSGPITSECSGDCAAVTERCVACIQKERERQRALGSATAHGEDDAYDDGERADWPPYPFWPAKSLLSQTA